MTKYRRIFILGLILLACTPAAYAQDLSPAGEWLVHDKTAHIRIMDCSGRMWGVISWVATPGTDSNNPDPAMRSRSVLGMPIILGMQATQANLWEGDIYNADNGKTYRGTISLKSNDKLHVSGCVLGFLCGGEDWTKLPPQPGHEVIRKNVCNTLAPPSATSPPN